MVQVPYGNCISWLKKEFSNVERRKNLTTAHGEQRDDNVRKGYSFAWHQFWNTVFGEKRRKFFFFTLFFFI